MNKFEVGDYVEIEKAGTFIGRKAKVVGVIEGGNMFDKYMYKVRLDPERPEYDYDIVFYQSDLRSYNTHRRCICGSGFDWIVEHHYQYCLDWKAGKPQRDYKDILS